MKTHHSTIIKGLLFFILMGTVILTCTLLNHPDWNRLAEGMPRFVQNQVSYRLVSMDQYLAYVQDRIKSRWHPEPVFAHNTILAVRFGVFPSGQVNNIKLLHSSGSDELDNTALQAIRDSAPFPPVPQTSHEQNVQIEMTFEYNVVKSPPPAQKKVAL